MKIARSGRIGDAVQHCKSKARVEAKEKTSRGWKYSILILCAAFVRETKICMGWGPRELLIQTTLNNQMNVFRRD